METLYLWRWYLPDLKGNLRSSRWRMTEANAQARHPGCTKVEGTLEIRQFERDTGHTFASGLVRREDGAMMPPEAGVEGDQSAALDARWEARQDAS